MAVTGTAITSSSDVCLSFQDLYLAVAEYVYGIRTGLSADQTTEAKRIANGGYLEFLRDHDWTFLSPQATLSVSEDDETTTLPAGFGQIIDHFTFDPGGSISTRIRPLSSAEIRRLKTKTSNMTGPIQYYAIQAVTFVPATGQRYEALWYPVSNADRTLYYRYRVAATLMSSDAEFPLGGQLHAWTIQESCLRMAEKYKDNVNGAHSQIYIQQALPASIRRDTDLRPGNLGYMGDASIYRGACGAPLRATVEHS